jgi:hypothetical protein
MQNWSDVQAAFMTAAALNTKGRVAGEDSTWVMVNRINADIATAADNSEIVVTDLVDFTKTVWMNIDPTRFAKPSFREARAAAKKGDAMSAPKKRYMVNVAGQTYVRTTSTEYTHVAVHVGTRGQYSETWQQVAAKPVIGLTFHKSAAAAAKAKCVWLRPTAPVRVEPAVEAPADVTSTIALARVGGIPSVWWLADDAWCPEGCGGHLTDEYHIGAPCKPVGPMY